MLENELLEAQNERDRHARLAKNCKERLAETEKDRKDLADEYVVLKTNYLALVREHEKEVSTVTIRGLAGMGFLMSKMAKKSK